MKRNALQLSSWFEEVSLSSGPLPPVRDFTKVFDQIRDEESWEPKVSTTLLKALKISALTSLGQPSLAGLSLSGMTGSMTGDSTISGETSVGMPRPAPADGNNCYQCRFSTHVHQVQAGQVQDAGNSQEYSPK